MTDYKNLKLIATSNPHIRGNETTRSIMLDVIIAMCPALIWAIIYFGVEALLLTVVSVVGCVFFEWAYRKIMHKPQSIGDLSAVVTGMLLSFVCPATTPLWMILIGDFFAIVVVKQLFGGIGKNFLNPALAGRAALLASYAGSMTTWLPAGVKAAIGGGLFLGAFFMATDYATSPVTKKGQLIYGIGCGLFTVFIRYFGSYNEGVCYSIMVMNCCTALIDKYTKPVRFGVVKSDKKEAAAK